MIDEQSPILTVSDLNRMARLAVERALPIAWVGGEISNLTRAPSGHWYFTLKDANAAVRCAMFRNRNQFVDWRPENGMQVEVRAQATLYEQRGEFQLTVEAMRRAGLGALFEAFQKLKEKLEREGVFAAERKRAIPGYPGYIGIVTSPNAAALRDVLTTLRRRWPLASVLLFPTAVQGSGAAARIAAAIDIAGRRGECDVLLVVRGGGSIEDLWAFNEEPVARAIADCPIPVISGIGHETDFTMADFASDLRAPTPTAAAQLATPERTELLQRAGKLGGGVRSAMRRKLDSYNQRLDGLYRRLAHPAARLEGQAKHLGHLTQRLILAQQSMLARRRLHTERLADRLASNAPDPARLRENVEQMRYRLSLYQHALLRRHADKIDSLSSQLAHLNPQAVLERGFSIVRDDAGAIIHDSRQVARDSGISVILAKGRLKARVIDTQSD
jgi:exodeoxyribonuclease VII large subunit